ncbi:MAG: hypothetical protein HYZ29_19025 [Myxococcales bacterium]|nr:hypothetical protein [Myxococcales bacterium]
MSLAGCSDGEEASAEPDEPCVCVPGGGGAGGDTGSACVEYRVSSALLPANGGWKMFAPGVTLPVHPFWRDAQGVHVAWTAVTPSPGDSDRGTAHLLVTSFSVPDGAPAKQAVYDVFPQDLRLAYSGSLDDVAANADGMFAVGFRYRESPQQEPEERVLLGSLTDPASQKIWTPPWPEISLWEIAWDGEAFALHFGLSNPGLQDWGIRLVRLSPDGTLLSGPDVVASSAVVQDAFFVATDPVTGTTVFASPGATGVLLSGHLRDRTPLFPDDPYFAREVAAQGVPAESSKFSGWPAVALEGERGAVSWMGHDIDYDSYVQPLDDFAPSADALVLPSGDDGAWGLGRRVLARAQGGWQMVAAISGLRLDALEIRDDSALQRRPLVRHFLRESCARTDTCPEGIPALDARNLHLVRHQDEMWFGFLDYSDSFDHDDQVDPLIAYRIINARSKCAYPSLYDEHHPGKGGGGGS